jgi:hypothetical protein
LFKDPAGAIRSNFPFERIFVGREVYPLWKPENFIMERDFQYCVLNAEKQILAAGNASAQD